MSSLAPQRRYSHPVDSQNRAKGANLVLFDDQVSNVTWTFDMSSSLGTNIGSEMWAGQYFEGNNFYIYIRGSEDPDGDWWSTQSDYKMSHRTGGVLVNCHFDS